MAKPVIPQGFVLDEQPQETQQGNFGLPAGFELDDNSQPNESKMSMGEAVFITKTNPLGFGDEIKAGISAGVAKLFGGQATQNIDIGDLYREARTSERAKLEKARQDQPLASFAGQMFSDIGVAGKSLKALGLAGQGFGTAVKGGAVLGGVSALGETEDLTNIPQTLKDVATGTVAGGVLGGAVQKVFKKGGDIAQGFSKFSGGVSKVLGKIGEVGGKILDSPITTAIVGTLAPELLPEVEVGGRALVSGLKAGSKLAGTASRLTDVSSYKKASDVKGNLENIQDAARRAMDVKGAAMEFV